MPRVRASVGESERANHYAIKRRIVGSETQYSDQKTQPASEARLFIDRNVVNGVTYQYQVVSINESGDSEPATTAQVTPTSQVQPDGMFEVGQQSGTSSLAGPAPETLSLAARAASPDGYLGDNVYNTTGSGQTWYVPALRSQTITFNLRFQNDSKVADKLVITGSKESDGWNLIYQDTVTGSADMDQQVKNGGFTLSLAPGASHRLRLLVTPAASVAVGQVRNIPIKATSTVSPKQVDIIVAQAKAVAEETVAKFSGLTSGRIRLCAGGVAVDGVHSGIYGVQLLKGGVALPNAAISLEIAGNISRGKKAQFISGSARSETLQLTTDAQGNASFTLLSSDTISTAGVQVKYQNLLVGQVECQFSGAQGIRRRGIETFQEGFPLDTGWLSTPEVLSTIGERGTVGAYLKWRKDLSLPTTQEYFDASKKPLTTLADDSNWLPVNGHRLRISIRQIAIKTANGETEADPETYGDYVRILGADANGGITVSTHNLSTQEAASLGLTPGSFETRGVSPFPIEAGPMIDKVLWFAFQAEDLDQHAR